MSIIRISKENCELAGGRWLAEGCEVELEQVEKKLAETWQVYHEIGDKSRERKTELASKYFIGWDDSAGGHYQKPRPEVKAVVAEATGLPISDISDSPVSQVVYDNILKPEFDQDKRLKELEQRHLANLERQRRLEDIKRELKRPELEEERRKEERASDIYVLITYKREKEIVEAIRRAIK